MSSPNEQSEWIFGWHMPWRGLLASCTCFTLCKCGASIRICYNSAVGILTFYRWRACRNLGQRAVSLAAGGTC